MGGGGEGPVGPVVGLRGAGGEGAGSGGDPGGGGRSLQESPAALGAGAPLLHMPCKQDSGQFYAVNLLFIRYMSTCVSGIRTCTGLTNPNT
jgi:hypothetical protein